MATCRYCGANALWGFDVVSKKWILLDPHPVPRARYALIIGKAAVDMVSLPLTLDEIPAAELIGLSLEKRALLRRLYEEGRYRAHRTVGCPGLGGVVPIRAVLHDVLDELERRAGEGARAQQLRRQL